MLELQILRRSRDGSVVRKLREQPFSGIKRSHCHFVCDANTNAFS